MKKSIFIISLLLLALGLWAADITITDVTGKVQISANGAVWTDVSGGEALSPGTMISTGFRSSATLSTGDAEIAVAQLTRLTIEELLEQEDTVTTTLFLNGGRINADVSRERVQHDFTVRSPVATASVRGTGFTFDGRRLEVHHGAVMLVTPQGMALALQGESLMAMMDNELMSAFINLLLSQNVSALITLIPSEEIPDIADIDELSDLEELAGQSAEELEELIEEIIDPSSPGIELPGPIDPNPENPDPVNPDPEIPEFQTGYVTVDFQ